MREIFAKEYFHALQKHTPMPRYPRRRRGRKPRKYPVRYKRSTRMMPRQVRGRRAFATGKRGQPMYRLPALPGIAPKRAIVKFKVCGSFLKTTDMAADTTDDGVLVSLSDPNDPFGAASAVQPTGFNQWMAFFNKGRVIHTNVSVSFVLIAAGAVQQEMVVGVIPEAGDGASALPSDIADTIKWTEWCEYPRARHRFINDVDQNAGAGRMRTTFKYHCAPHKFFNDTPRNDNNEFKDGTSPVNEVGLHVLMSTGNTAAVMANDTNYFIVYITVEMTCLLFDRKNLAQS